MLSQLCYLRKFVLAGNEPTYCKSDTCLLRWRKSKNVAFSSLVDAFKNREIRHDSSSVEVLETVENDVVAIGGNFQVTVSRIYRTWRISRVYTQVCDSHLQ